MIIFSKNVQRNIFIMLKAAKLTPIITSTLKNNKINKNYALTQRTAYNFVNMPISSKYYHTELPINLEAALRLAQKQQKLNQKCYLLQHIVQLVERDPKLRILKVDDFMKKELLKWGSQNYNFGIGYKQNGGRFQRIMTIAWIIKKMGYEQELKQLYNNIIDRVQQDQFYVDFQQIIKGVQAFCSYSQKSKRDVLFDKFQRYLMKTLNDYDITVYQKIVLSLVEAQRYKGPIWDKVQHYVLRALGLTKSPRVFFDIFKCFAITHNGSSMFYQACQQMIYKGHLHNKTFLLRNNLSQFNSNGDFFALIVQTYAVVNKYTPFPIQADMLNYLYKSMMASRTQYIDISALTKIVKNMQLLQFCNKQTDTVIYDIINNKQFSSYHSLSDIQQLFFAMQARFGYVNQRIKANVQKLVIKDMDRNILSLPKAIEIVQFLLMYRKYGKQSIQNNIVYEHNVVNQQASNVLIHSLNKTIDRKYKYLSIKQQKQVIDQLKSNPQIQDKLKQSILMLPTYDKPK